MSGERGCAPKKNKGRRPEKGPKVRPPQLKIAKGWWAKKNWYKKVKAPAKKGNENGPTPSDEFPRTPGRPGPTKARTPGDQTQARGLAGGGRGQPGGEQLAQGKENPGKRKGGGGGKGEKKTINWSSRPTENPG